MEQPKNLKRCGTCDFFYDVYVDGTGKCDRAFGAITHADHGTTCKAYRFDERYFEKELEF